MMNKTIDKMIKDLIAKCVECVSEAGDGLLRFVDPIDGNEISGHYGLSHLAAALIIYGFENSDNVIISLGNKLLESLLQRWDAIKQLPDFHNDFNSFALCIIWDYLSKNHSSSEYLSAIQKTVISTEDSSHSTINWMPMRWYVNKYRYLWTTDKKYLSKCEECKSKIKDATYSDGFIDDRLPRGMSFNLQYDIATVAGMQYLKTIGEDLDISRELGALLKSVFPDGDINYLGRGANQIFAWGLWVFLLVSSKHDDEAEKALCYLDTHLNVMLDNSNMMLNEWCGNEKYMWWDYHYSSVYTAHLLLWLVLSRIYNGSFPVNEKQVLDKTSGISIIDKEDCFSVYFEGRKEYLAEAGPCIAAFIKKNSGLIVKGMFGPWQGAFGNKYESVCNTLFNYFGLLDLKQNYDFSKNRYVHKLAPSLSMIPSVRIMPLFTNVVIIETEDTVNLLWKNEQKKSVIMNIPSLTEIKNVRLFVDGKDSDISLSMKIRNQYDWVNVYQSKMSNGIEWKLVLEK